MLPLLDEHQSAGFPNDSATVLELNVSNHPGVMSHVCGLFSRRGYNVEGILCLPIGSGATSRIWLLVNEDKRLDQMIRQMIKLQDVHEVRRHETGQEIFQRLEVLLTQ